MSLESLAEIDDGSLGLLVRNSLQAIARDCVNRPTDPTVRVAEIKLKFKPVANGGDLKHIEFVPEVKSKVPTYRTAPMVIRASNAGFAYAPEEVDGSATD